jgi:16S rRNA processing protein RimM
MGDGSLEGYDLNVEKRLLIAEILAAHGVRGLVKLRIFGDDIDLVEEHEALFTSETGAHTLKLTIKNQMGGIWLAAVDGVPDRTAAEKLRGTKLYLSRDILPELDDEDTFYHTDLIGLMVVDTNGTGQGKITSVVNFGASDLIDIKPEKGMSFYVPFTPDYVVDTNLEKGQMTIQNFEDFKATMPEKPPKATPKKKS